MGCLTLSEDFFSQATVKLIFPGKNTTWTLKHFWACWMFFQNGYGGWLRDPVSHETDR